MNRWLAIAPLVVLAALAAVFVGWSLKRDPVYRPDALVGRPLPTASLSPLQGSLAGPAPVALAQAAAGQPRVVNLFASWCAPCRVEHPNLAKLRARGIAVVGVAYKDNPVATRAYLNELGDPYAAVLLDPEGRVGLDLGVSGVPESFAVDANGLIVAKASGPIITDADVERLAAALGR
ncbi:thiol:disulfide interchange protein [Brevundimonas sp. Leaf363]|uniref:DsbE family thiol:disulfide interchange protein n=1 Tax=Brevundimonas sp. Leaf363 TaxID=1736353 RepID=UPI0006FBC860|nr:DsbE family thiol:disulfide interchange protein [Brevundimonas sp. Leaf363]KQS57416.1 thiol:disulfide interchange protein [Brevundimonas sp. Leaf363]